MDPFRGRDIEGDGISLAALQLYLHLPLLDRAVAVRTEDLDLAHIHGICERDGDDDLSAPRLWSQLHLALVLEQIGGAAGHRETLILQGRRDDGGGIQYLGTARVILVVLDVGQVSHIYLAVAVEIEREILPAQLFAHGFKILMIDLIITGDIAQGEGTVAGAQDQMLGVSVQGDFGMERLIASSGELDRVLPGGQAGELRLVIAHPLLCGQHLAVHVLHHGGDPGGKPIRAGCPIRQRDRGLKVSFAHLQLDIPSGGVLRRLGQVEAQGDSNGAGGGRAPLGIGRRRKYAGQAGHTHRARQQQAERSRDPSFRRSHDLTSFLF